MLRYRLILNAPAFLALWLILTRLNSMIDPLWSYYLALVAMYATAMLGMVILVGLSGQVSLGNGALMAVGGYAFAVSSLHWTTVPLLGLPWNAVWSMVVAALIGLIAGLVIGGIGARLRGPYLAGLTLGLAVGIPAIAARFEGLLGGSQGLLLTVPYPSGGYAAATSGDVQSAAADQSALDAALSSTAADPSAAPSEMASSDMLTVGDVAGGSSIAATPMPTGITSPSASAAADLASTAPVVDPGFILERWEASMAVAVACIAGFVALNLVRGRQGRVWRAVRDDPIAAAVTGINPAGAKVSAFAMSSVFAALSGAVFAQILAYVGPTAFGIGLSLSLLVGVVLGGRGSLAGAVIGAVLIVGLPALISRVADGRDWPQQVANNAPTLLYGLLVVIVVVLAPAGVAGLWRRRHL